jgi:hypothetical protein
MTIAELIAGIEDINEDAIIFAKRVNGTFLASSETFLVELVEDEEDLPTAEMANKYCPGFDYFLEVFLVKDLVLDFSGAVGYKASSQLVERIIYYAQNDA